MSFKKIFLSFLMIFSVFYSVFAQTYETEAQREEREKRDAAALEKLNQRALPVLDLSAFLPAEQNSWLISIVVHEAWGKTSKIAAVVRSDGNFLCRDENLAQNHPVNPAEFTKLADFVKFFQEGLNPAYEAATDCKQCTVETLQFSFRTPKKNKGRSYVFNMDNHPNALSPVRRLYDSVKNAVECENFVK